MADNRLCQLFPFLFLAKLALQQFGCGRNNHEAKHNWYRGYLVGAC
jgi:hypothetical protein